jgi:hypothetical protein
MKAWMGWGVAWTTVWLACPAWTAQASANPASEASWRWPGQVETRDLRGAWLVTPVEVHQRGREFKVQWAPALDWGALGRVAALRVEAGAAQWWAEAPEGQGAIALKPNTLERLTEQRGLQALAGHLAQGWASTGTQALPERLCLGLKLPGVEAPTRYGAWRWWRAPGEALPRAAEYEDAGKVTLRWRLVGLPLPEAAWTGWQAPPRVVDGEGGLGL